MVVDTLLLHIIISHYVNFPVEILRLVHLNETCLAIGLAYFDATAQSFYRCFFLHYLKS